MASYFITGKLGSGKSLCAVGKIFEYMAAGRAVATNLDIYLPEYMLPTSKKTLLRLPDKPTVFDLTVLGSGNDSPDEEKNGLLVLDELGSWFNSRAWQDKSRQPLLEWFIHARKYGWDVFLLVQSIDMVDNQLRDMLGEHLVICKRLDRVKIPYLGNVLRWLGFKGNLPKIHVATVFYGDTISALVVDKWRYMAKNLYRCYNTKQVFSSLYDSGIYSLLSPWHTVGRYLPSKQSLRARLQAAWSDYFNPPRPVHIALRPKHPLIDRIMKLPEEKRIEFFKRFEQCGSFSV